MCACAYLATGASGAALMLLVLCAAIGVIAALRPPPWLLGPGAAAIALEGWVSARGWIDAVPHLDTLAHFAFALLAGIVLAAPLGVAAGGAAVALGMVWELYEWGSDATLGTNMSLGYRDTLTDLAAVVTGAGLASRLAFSGRAA